MNDGRLTILINGREALPLRAIPYVTSWIRFNPDTVVSYLSRGEFDGRYFSKRSCLISFRLIGSKPVLINPTEWHFVATQLDGSKAELKRKNGNGELSEEKGYESWKKESLSILPAGVFIWLDEFKKEFQADKKLVSRIDIDSVVMNEEHEDELKFECNEEDSDDQKIIKRSHKEKNEVFKEKVNQDQAKKQALLYPQLILAPMIDANTRAMVLEGFDTHKAQSAHNAKQAVPDAEKDVSSKANDKPPGEMPRIEAGQLTIEAAWEIECETGEKTTSDIVIARLQMWANEKPNNHPALIKSIPHGVVWVTKKDRKEKKYMIEHCGNHLAKWYKSRI